MIDNKLILTTQFFKIINIKLNILALKYIKTFFMLIIFFYNLKLSIDSFT
jgi:hypothetical protein